MYGSKNYNFKGYYHTSHGIFESSRLAAREIGCSKTSILRRVKNPKNKEYYFTPKGKI